MGIDIGTGSFKAALFDINGRMAGVGQVEYSFDHPQPMWSQIEPELVWRKVVSGIQKCMDSANVNKKDISGIGISCIGDTGIALDISGEPLSPAIESTDMRANAYREYIKLFEREIGSSAIFSRTGYPLSSLSPLLKILWLRDNYPSIYSEMVRYGTFQEYIIWKMTGKPYVDYTLASRTMAFDISEKQWIKEFLNKVSIKPDLFSDTVPSDRVVGYITDKIALETGLPSGLPVVCGAHDQCCSAIGMGILDSGMVGDGSGSVEALVRIGDSPQSTERFREFGIGCQCHGLENKYMSIAFHLTSGSLVRWYRNELGQTEMLKALETGCDPYDLLTEEAGKSPSGASGLMLLPHFLGSGTCRKPPLNPNSRGALLGLSLTHTKKDITRAVFEGINYETKYLLDVLTHEGEDVRVLVVTGGAAKSDFWMQLKADITGKTVVVPAVTETSCLGAAILAGMGTGVYADYRDAANRACCFASEYTPDSETCAIYREYYEVYKDIYKSVVDIHDRLAKLERKYSNASVN